jgi:hypothetical protein
MVAPEEVQAVSQNVDGWSYIERDAGQMSDGKFDFREEDVVCVVGRKAEENVFVLSNAHSPELRWNEIPPRCLYTVLSSVTLGIGRRVSVWCVSFDS